MWIICRMPARQGAKRNIISFNPCSCSPFCAVLVIGGAPSQGPQVMIKQRLSTKLTMVWCGRSNEHPYGLVRIACGLVRGRHKARPLQLTMVWCGRSNERPYGMVRIACGLVRGRHKARPLQLTMVWCGRSNERPYLSVVGVFDDCAVGARCCVGTETARILRQA